MRNRDLAAILISLRLGLARMNRITAAVILVNAVAALLWMVVLPACEERNAVAASRLRSLRAAAVAHVSGGRQPAAPQMDPQKAFRDMLGNESAIAVQMKALLNAAKTNQLAVRQTQYKSMRDASGGFVAWQVDLPVQGRYQDIRKFCEEVLLAFPHAALEEVRFKRDTISSGVVDSSLRFQFYMRPGALAPTEGIAPQDKEAAK